MHSNLTKVAIVNPDHSNTPQIYMYPINQFTAPADWQLEMATNQAEQAERKGKNQHWTLIKRIACTQTSPRSPLLTPITPLHTANLHVSDYSIHRPCWLTTWNGHEPSRAGQRMEGAPEWNCWSRRSTDRRSWASRRRRACARRGARWSCHRQGHPWCCIAGKKKRTGAAMQRRPGAYSALAAAATERGGASEEPWPRSYGGSSHNKTATTTHHTQQGRLGVLNSFLFSRSLLLFFFFFFVGVGNHNNNKGRAYYTKWLCLMIGKHASGKGNLGSKRDCIAVHWIDNTCWPGPTYHLLVGR